MNNIIKLILLFAALTPLGVSASLSINTLSDQAFPGAINGVAFQQDAITTYNGYQYAVYWSANRHVAVARRALPDSPWQSFELTDYTFNTDNDHYDISLGLSPLDGTLHLSFYQWSSIFNYRKSAPNILDNPEQVNWNASLFGPVENGLLGSTMDPTTYPRFVTAPSGKLLLLLRHGASGAGDSYLYEYDGNTGQWSGLGKLVDGLATDINAYFNGIHYDPNGRLHASWVWRATPDATTNFNLHYIYSDDDGRTWYNNANQQVATTGSQPITQNTPGIAVWQIEQNRGLINQESQTVDSQGRISMLMSHLPDELPSSSNFDNNRLQARVFHYRRDLQGQWHRSMLPGATFSYARNKIAADGDGNLFAVINRDGIYRATAAQQWQDWQLVQPLTDQSIIEEVQLDHKRLLQENVLSFVHINRLGQFLQFDYTDADQAPDPKQTGGGPAGYIFCALEGQTCTTPANADVAYGANGQFFHLNSSGSIVCDGSTFGDPINKVFKRCYYSVAGLDNYQLCADEGQTCQVNGLSQVAFGAEGAFNYRLVQDDIACNNVEFGDPINGTVKPCYILPISNEAPTSSSSSSSASTSSQSSVSSVSSSVSSSSGSESEEETGGGAINDLFVFMSLLLLTRFRSNKLLF